MAFCEEKPSSVSAWLAEAEAATSCFELRLALKLHMTASGRRHRLRKLLLARLAVRLLPKASRPSSFSSIPLFIGFVKGGIPLGVTLAFLITSPLVNEVAVAMFLGSFGLRATMIYVVSGILLGTAGGFLLGRFELERYLSPWVRRLQTQSDTESEAWAERRTPFADRFPVIVRDAWGVVRSVLPYVLAGIGVGAAMHGYVPEGFFEQYMSKDNWFAVPLAVICAVPMYANAAGIVPVIQVFVAKGIPLGTAVAFMMGVVGLSLPEAAMLKKEMTWRLIGIFFAVMTSYFILSGYVFNMLL